MQVANDRREAEDEDQGEAEDDGDEQKQDGQAARDMAFTAKIEAHDGVDDGHEDHGEERADIDQKHNIAQPPRERKRQQDAEGEEDVSTDGAGGLGLRAAGLCPPEG